MRETSALTISQFGTESARISRMVPICTLLRRKPALQVQQHLRSRCSSTCAPGAAGGYSYLITKLSATIGKLSANPAPWLAVVLVRLCVCSSSRPLFLRLFARSLRLSLAPVCPPVGASTAAQMLARRKFCPCAVFAACRSVSGQPAKCCGQFGGRGGAPPLGHNASSVSVAGNGSGLGHDADSGNCNGSRTRNAIVALPEQRGSVDPL